MPEQPSADPFERFAGFYETLAASSEREPYACALATASAAGVPSVRMVLVRRWDRDGFRVFSHKPSPKGSDLSENPRAELCFYRDALQLQVRIAGEVVPLPPEEEDAYFDARPLKSKLGAWASKQSQPMSDPDALAHRLDEAEARFTREGEVPPRPEWWGGWLIRPLKFEYWTGRPFRLHERELYVRETAESPWRHAYIYP